MGAAAATARLPRGFGAEWVKDPIDIETWPRAARRVYRYLKRRVRMRKAEHRPKDREIGLEIGDMEGREPFHRRTVQRGLKFLQGLGAIFRDHSDGHGRIIRVLMPLAGDGAQQKEGEAPKERAKAGSKERAGTSPATSPAAAPPPPPDPVEDPPAEAPDRRSPSAALRAEVERIKSEMRRPAEAPAEAPQLPPKRIPGVVERDLAYLELKEQLGDLTPSERSRLADLRAGRGP